jgi:uncharacterized membrane protein
MPRALILLVLVTLAFAGLTTSTSALPQADHDSTEHSHEESEQATEQSEGAQEHGHATEESEGAQEHDHATDHGDESGGLTIMLGKVHPMVVHFPIALILAAGLAELLILVGGSKWLWLQGSSRFGIALGGMSALLAAPLGWLAASNADYGPDLLDTLLYHRILGVTTAVAAVLLWIISERLARSQDRGTSRKMYRSLLFATCLIIPITGHLGATLVFGPGFLA